MAVALYAYCPVVHASFDYGYLRSTDGEVWGGGGGGGGGGDACRHVRGDGAGDEAAEGGAGYVGELSGTDRHAVGVSDRAGRIGYYIGESWLRWMLMATGMAVLAARHFNGNLTYRPGVVACVILLLSWIAVGEGALRLITNLVIRANDNPLPPGTFPPIVGMIGLVLASAGLTLWGSTPGQFYVAMLLTVGPVTVLFGGYGLMLLVFVTCGRNMRWN